MFTWQAAAAMFCGAIVLAVLYITVCRRGYKTVWEFPADDGNDESDEKRLDWGRRRDFWLAEFDRAHAERDLLGEELARESMEFLLDTEPPQVAEPQPVLPTLPPPSPPSRPRSPAWLRSGQKIAKVWAEDAEPDLSEALPRDGERMSGDESRYLQKEAYPGYMVGAITDKQWNLVLHAREDGRSFYEVCTLIRGWEKGSPWPDEVWTLVHDGVKNLADSNRLDEREFICDYCYQPVSALNEKRMCLACHRAAQ